MIVEKLYIKSFGTLNDRTFEFDRGINIIRGANESGKSTVCAFLRFLFYGLPSKTDEKLRYISWGSSMCGGSGVFTDGGRRVRIEREVMCSTGQDGKNVFRERAGVYDDETGAQLMKGADIGESFFGVPESVFVSTVYINQIGESKVGDSSLCDAAENILFSADESVNMKKALKKLDEARIYLSYKNKRGGRLAELADKKAGLEERLERAKASSTEIIDLEGSRRSVSKMKDDDSEKLAVSNAELDEYERYRVKKLYLRALEEKRMASSLSKQITDLEGDPERRIYSDEYISKLTSYASAIESAQANVNACRSAATTAEQKITDMKEKTELFERLGSQPEKRNDRVGRAKSLNRETGVMSALVTGGLAAATIFAAIMIMSYFLPFPPFVRYLGAGVCGAGILCAAVCLIISLSKKKELASICSYFGCRSYAEFEEMLAVASRDEAVITYIKEARRSAREKQRQAEEAFDTLSNKTASELLASGFTVERSVRESLDAALTECRRVKAEIEKLGAVLNGHKNNISAIAEELRRYSTDYVMSSYRTEFDTERLEAFDYQNKKKINHLLTSSVTTRGERLAQIDMRLALLKAANDDPAVLSEELAAVTNETEELTVKAEAYELASDSLKNGAQKLRDGISPRLAKTASGIVAKLSDGKYSKIGVDADFGMTFSDGTSTHSVGELSAGTGDMTYLALRIALIEVLYKKSVPPFIFDESFSRLDDTRLKNVLSLLSEISGAEGQCLLFTCHGREERVMKTVSPYKPVTI